MLSALDLPFNLGEAKVDVGLSIGIAQFPEHGRDAETMLRHADVAMYVAKRNKFGYVVYSPDQDEHSAARLALMGEMRQAIRERQLVLHYQPKVDLRLGTVYGVEALVRWNHPEHGHLSPDQFVPLAEQTDLMSSLARWVMDESLAQVEEWRKSGLELTISVNLSAANLHEANLPEDIAELLARHSLPASSLTVEITESAIMAAKADKTVRRLSEMGVGVSIDDFGTGYSSLSYLKTLPVDEIKIDRSFVRDMAIDSDDAAIVQPTIDLGHNLTSRWWRRELRTTPPIRCCARWTATTPTGTSSARRCRPRSSRSGCAHRRGVNRLRTCRIGWAPGPEKAPLADGTGLIVGWRPMATLVPG